VARYFDTSNPTFRIQALTILMLLLLALALTSAWGTMAYRRHLQGPWYKKLLPQGAAASTSARAGFPGNAATFSWRSKLHPYPLEMTFFKVDRSAIEADHSAMQKSPLAIRLFPKSQGWLQPHMTIERVLGIPLLLWQSFLAAPPKPASSHTIITRITAFRYVVLKPVGSDRFDVLVFGAHHAPGRFDNALFAQLVDRMVVGEH
jgi:hypothetical protein